jgi:hypothetical protein
MPSRLPALSLLALAACAGPSIPDTQGGGAILAAAHREAVEVPGWLELRNLSAHTLAESGEPKAPFVRGVWLGGLFLPRGEIEGEFVQPPPRRIMVRGRLDLTTRAFVPEGRPVAAPHVPGLRDRESGAFYPSGPIVWEALDAAPAGGTAPAVAPAGASAESGD